MVDLFDPCREYARQSGCLELYLEDNCVTCAHLDDHLPCPTLKDRWADLIPVPVRPPLQGGDGALQPTFPNPPTFPVASAER